MSSDTARIPPEYLSAKYYFDIGAIYIIIYNDVRILGGTV